MFREGAGETPSFIFAYMARRVEVAAVQERQVFGEAHCEEIRGRY